MKTKPFDLEAAKRGEKVVTRDGKSVRIICTDRVNELYGQPIVALVPDSDGDEDIEEYNLDGSYGDTGRTEEDLRMLDESPTEGTYIAIVRSAAGSIALHVAGPFPERVQAQEMGELVASKIKMITVVEVMSCTPVE